MLHPSVVELKRIREDYFSKEVVAGSVFDNGFSNLFFLTFANS